MSSTTIIVDDTDRLISYGGAWSVVQGLAQNSNEYNGTVHRADQNGMTVEYKFSGTRISIYGTVESPAIYGVPASTYTIDNGEPEAFNQTGSTLLIESTDITSHILFYQSPTLGSGEHTLKWTVSNVTSSGPRYYFDFLVIENPPSAVLSQGETHIIVDDNDTGIEYNGSWPAGGSIGEYLLSDHGSAAEGGTSATYKFTGTGISVYGTLGANHYPLAEIAFNMDGAQNGSFIATASEKFIQNTLLYQVSGLTVGQHELTILTKNSSSWWLDYLVYEPAGGSSPSTSNSTTSTSNSNSHSNSNSGTSSTGESSAKKSTSVGPIVGGVLGGIAVLTLGAFILWWIRRRNQIQNKQISEAAVPEGSQFAKRDIANTNTGTDPNTAKNEKSGLFKSRPLAPTPAPAPAPASPPNARSISASPLLTANTLPTTPETTVEANTGPPPAPETSPAQKQPQDPTNPTQPRERRRREPIREVDGGVRLASGDSDDDDEPPEILPPSYARY